MKKSQPPKRLARERKVHQPVGKVRTSLTPTHNRAFSSRHIRSGSRVFDALFRFVAGISVGMALASVCRGGWRNPVILYGKWPHHPITDSIALGFMIGVALATFPYAYFRAREKVARMNGEPEPEFRWLGRRVASISFSLTYFVLWFLGLNGVSLLP